MQKRFSTGFNTTKSVQRLLLITTILLPGVLVHAQQLTPLPEPDSPAFTTAGTIAETPTEATSSLLSATVSVDRNTVYVSEQLLVTVNVLGPVSAFNLREEKLIVSQADVYVLQKKKSEIIRNGSPYRLVSTSYALFFRNPGLHAIPSLTMTATLPVSAGGEGATTNPKISTSSQQLDITVNPEPIVSTGWLPARDVTAQSQWQFDGNPSEFIEGQPANKRYEIQITGQFPTAIPVLNYSVPDGVRLYVNQPSVEKHSDKSGIRGTLIQVITIIPERTGKHQLPSLAIDWWDIDNHQWQQTTIPAETINVSASPHVTAEVKSSYYRVILALAFATCIVCLACAFFYRKFRLTNASFQNYFQQGNSRSRGSEKQAWAKLKKALNARDPHRVRSAVVDWHSIINESDTFCRLDQISTHNKELRNAFNRLDASIYSHPGTTNYGLAGDVTTVNYRALKAKLAQWRKKIKQSGATSRQHNGSDDRIDLYPVRKEQSS